MSVQKKFLKTKPVCKAKFILPKEAAPNATSVSLVGDFNNWGTDATPMKKLKDGSFAIEIDLPSGHEYQYRYLINGSTWENDWAADRYTPSPYGIDNSVVSV